jgi:uncharacterized protein (TIGR02594 family)
LILCGTHTFNQPALSWKKWGKTIPDPCYGAIVVFDYGEGKGHVGFATAKSGDRILVLGGNQSNQVQESKFKKRQNSGIRDSQRL